MGEFARDLGTTEDMPTPLTDHAPASVRRPPPPSTEREQGAMAASLVDLKMEVGRLAGALEKGFAKIDARFDRIDRRHEQEQDVSRERAVKLEHRLATIEAAEEGEDWDDLRIELTKVKARLGIDAIAMVVAALIGLANLAASVFKPGAHP